MFFEFLSARFSGVVKILCLEKLFFVQKKGFPKMGGAFFWGVEGLGDGRLFQGFRASRGLLPCSALGWVVSRCFALSGHLCSLSGLGSSGQQGLFAHDVAGCAWCWSSGLASLGPHSSMVGVARTLSVGGSGFLRGGFRAFASACGATSWAGTKRSKACAIIMRGSSLPRAAPFALPLPLPLPLPRFLTTSP